MWFDRSELDKDEDKDEKRGIPSEKPVHLSLKSVKEFVSNIECTEKSLQKFIHSENNGLWGSCWK